MAGKIKITKIRSTIGRHPKQQKTIKALGMNKIGSSVIHNSTPDINGMVEKVKHLVRVEEVK